MNAIQPASDLRSSRRLHFGGKVVFNNCNSSSDCTLCDISDRGAKLVFAAHVAIPDEFDLVSR